MVAKCLKRKQTFPRDSRSLQQLSHYSNYQLLFSFLLKVSIVTLGVLWSSFHLFRVSCYWLQVFQKDFLFPIVCFKCYAEVIKNFIMGFQVTLDFKLCCKFHIKIFNICWSSLKSIFCRAIFWQHTDVSKYYSIKRSSKIIYVKYCEETSPVKGKGREKVVRIRDSRS